MGSLINFPELTVIDGGGSEAYDRSPYLRNSVYRNAIQIVQERANEYRDMVAQGRKGISENSHADWLACAGYYDEIRRLLQDAIKGQ